MDIIDIFYAARNEDSAAPMAKYMKDQFPYLGIKSPEHRVLAKDFLKQREKDHAIDWEFIWKCFGLPEREFQYLGLGYLGTVKHLLTPADIGSLEKLVKTKSWWDTVDTINSYVGDICLRYPELKETLIPRWMADDNIWLKRISIDFQLKYKDKTDTRTLSRVILANTGTKEFFVNKAIGWALREFSKTDKEWVGKFIEDNKDVLSPLSIREGSKYV